MNVFQQFHSFILTTLEALVQQGTLPQGLDFSKVVVQPPHDPTHGDLATNAAMVLAKPSGMAPKDLALLLRAQFERLESVQACTLAGPGFLNFHLAPRVWIEEMKAILCHPETYGNSTLGGRQKVNVEYVSTNPTGPLHIGHCRVAIVGDVLASLLEKVGYAVTREYYVNDAGGQANDLARSVYRRYLEALGHQVDGDAAAFGSYGGPYLIPVGKKLADQVGDRWVKAAEEAWLAEIRAFAIEEMMQLIRRDLAALNIYQDIFSSELAVVKAGKVQEAMQNLQAKGLIYQGVLEKPKGKEIEDWEEREQTLFKSTQFGDDTDRAIQKSDGSWTYFASDVAYHLDKLQRDTPILVNVWGADHAGYVKRISSAVKALSDQQAEIHCILCQMVRFISGGQVLKMSKRAGNFVTVQDALEKVGLDAMRFMMVSRKNDAALDFDFEQVVEQSKDNPVFYVQYAYARSSSIKRHIQALFPALDITPQTLATLDLSTLEQPEFMTLIKKLAQWPRILEMAAQTFEPHRITYYLHELASEFHTLWNQGKEKHHLRFINSENAQETQKNFSLITSLATVLQSGLKLLGVRPREEM
jgi:arginyl-tRNA synthetase